MVADRGPAEQRVADRLQRLLVFDDPLALVRVPGLVAVHVRSEHRPAGLLELQEQHVVRGAALQQRHVRPQPDRADADHLVGHVEERVAADDARPVRRQRAQVVVQAGGEQLGVRFGRPGDQRRLLARSGGAPPRCSVNRGSARSLVRRRARFAARLTSLRIVGLAPAPSWSTSSRSNERASSGSSARYRTCCRYADDAAGDRVRRTAVRSSRSAGRRPRRWSPAGAGPTPRRPGGPRRSR